MPPLGDPYVNRAGLKDPATVAPLAPSDYGVIGWLKKISSQLGGSLGTFGSPATTSVQSVQGAGYKAAVSITRTADTNAYTGGDVIGINNAGSPGSAILTFPNIGPAGGGHVYIDTISYEVDLASIPSGMTSFRLHLYSASPPSALLDNQAWDLASGDRSVYLDYIDLGTPVVAGSSTLFTSTDQYGKHIVVPSGGTLYGYLVTNGGYTPTSGAVQKPTLNSISV